MKPKRKSTAPPAPSPPASAAPPPKVSLRQLEQEVLVEGREWTRRRLQKRLQQLAEQHGEISPLNSKEN